ncbi:hypothetical protein NKR19_g5039 [Coniochaeta hoffmannii]|uniref:Uncharacterized protein n=1 Tax=Coniochaeta hoffmannii TaxID=91930 RepID=A0AA38VM44_9PEZI|nr:hypothetical protein NKR19_g5039 [Coniochaeta hoffmannii]
MASTVDQAQTTSGATEPPKAPEEAQGVKPTEDKAPQDKPAIDAEPTKADDLVTNNLPVGTASNGNNQEDIAPKEPQAAPTEAAKEHDPVATTAPVGTAAGGEKQEDIAPKEAPPTMTGALQGDAPAPATGPSDVAAAPAEEAVKGPAPTAEKPAAVTNGAEKDAQMTDVPAPEEVANAAVPAAGEKRKAEEETAPTNGDAKKVKADNTNGSEAATNGKAEPAKKAGRPSKKDKKPVEKAKEVVGRTLRKTRSQGPIDQ